MHITTASPLSQLRFMTTQGGPYDHTGRTLRPHTEDHNRPVTHTNYGTNLYETLYYSRSTGSYEILSSELEKFH